MPNSQDKDSGETLLERLQNAGLAVILDGTKLRIGPEELITSEIRRGIAANPRGLAAAIVEQDKKADAFAEWIATPGNWERLGDAQAAGDELLTVGVFGRWRCFLRSEWEGFVEDARRHEETIRRVRELEQEAEKRKAAEKVADKEKARSKKANANKSGLFA